MTLREAVSDVVKLNEQMNAAPCPCGGGLSEAMAKMEELAQSQPDEAWVIFRTGTDNEFAALVNSVMDIGLPFETAQAQREVMRLAKMRGTPLVMAETRAGFGDLFDSFWNEQEGQSQSVVKSRTFNELLQHA
ncbi:MAG: hypothetical protein FWB91_00180 [Defluviitaleaceae bacterium]|nr:hypothetical protein [Defluviitaleaceae bacterium]